MTSSVGNFANPKDPGLQDYGELMLRIDHMYVVNGDRCEYIDASDGKLAYFENLMNDVMH